MNGKKKTRVKDNPWSAETHNPDRPLYKLNTETREVTPANEAARNAMNRTEGNKGSGTERQ